MFLLGTTNHLIVCFHGENDEKKTHPSCDDDMDCYLLLFEPFFCCWASITAAFMFQKVIECSYFVFSHWLLSSVFLRLVLLQSFVKFLTCGCSYRSNIYKLWLGGPTLDILAFANTFLALLDNHGCLYQGLLKLYSNMPLKSRREDFLL